MMQSLNPTAENPLRLGTRGSPLALAQATEVKALLCRHHGWHDDTLKIVVMKTTGDKFTDRPLSEIGGKGLFTKELEIGLFDHTIDFAVHSMKDVATVLPDGLTLCAILEREDPRDAFVSMKHGTIADLPTGAVVGTSSLRRKAQLLRLRPDLEVVNFRGVVGTRLQKLDDGVAEATFLATAGLKRLGHHDLIGDKAHPIDTEYMLPASAQAAIGIEARAEDTELHVALSALNHQPTVDAITAEREMLRILDGSCRTPIAAHFVNGYLRGEVLSPDGQRRVGGEWRLSNDAHDPLTLGAIAGHDLLERGAADVLKG